MSRPPSSTCWRGDERGEDVERRRRLELVREIIASRAPSSQAELVQELAERGVVVDQSTVSRDLRGLGVVRVPGPGGRRVYGFAAEGRGTAAVDEEGLRRGLREFLVGMEVSGNLLVLRTGPGNAHALAALLDRNGREEVAGTVAGDDTILVVVREGYEARDLARVLREMAGL
ncbi:MAG: arginine repressor [Actinomycetota bacterium]|nr:arginine repressor [Actinomycetota bacterium]